MSMYCKRIKIKKKTKKNDTDRQLSLTGDSYRLNYPIVKRLRNKITDFDYFITLEFSRHPAAHNWAPATP